MIAADTSVVIAGFLNWHDFHVRALQALRKVMTERSLLIPFPVLVESYSVLTRLPSPHRLRPEAAHELLKGSFSGARVAGLSSRKAWTFLDDCVASAIVGGRIYDAVIATTAIEAGASELLTFNPRDFEIFRDRIAIIVP
jgi:predicted nucleic acid-binding protein